jgi:serine/threonine-protein kinase
MVMEYLEGQDLDAELAATGPMPPHVAVDYVLQACEAIAEAHGLGMIHRDLKLKNLFLTQTVDGRPLVKVLDFGLAKTIGTHNDVSLTATNSVFGSPQYMSPEQMRSAKDVDFRSDIWSLGVCLFELLTGQVPYDAQGVAEICAMVLKDPVPAPSQFVAGLPPDLEEVVLKCLEKDPSRRFQSVAELAFALQSYAPDEGSARRILHVMQTAQKFEHPTVFTSGATGPATDADPKTMNAWDSGLPRRTTLSRAQMYSAVALLLVLAMGGIAMLFAVAKREPRVPLAAASAPQAAPLESDAPPALPAVDPAPVATGSVPGVTSTATVAASATGAPPPVGPGFVDEVDAVPGTGPTTAEAAGSPTHLGKPLGARTARPAGPHPQQTSTKPGLPAPPSTSKGPAKPKNGPGSGADYM